jgi:hypothetical protein
LHNKRFSNRWFDFVYGLQKVCYLSKNQNEGLQERHTMKQTLTLKSLRVSIELPFGFKWVGFVEWSLLYSPDRQKHLVYGFLQAENCRMSSQKQQPKEKQEVVYSWLMELEV